MGVGRKRPGWECKQPGTTSHPWTMNQGPRMGLRQKTLWARLQYTTLTNVPTCRTQYPLSDRQAGRCFPGCLWRGRVNAGEICNAGAAGENGQPAAIQIARGQTTDEGGGPQGDETVLWEEEATSSSKEGWRRE